MDQRLHPCSRADSVIVQPQLAQSATVVKAFHRRDAVGEQPQPTERRAAAIMDGGGHMTREREGAQHRRAGEGGGRGVRVASHLTQWNGGFRGGGIYTRYPRENRFQEVGDVRADTTGGTRAGVSIMWNNYLLYKERLIELLESSRQWRISLRRLGWGVTVTLYAIRIGGGKGSMAGGG